MKLLTDRNKINSTVTAIFAIAVFFFFIAWSGSATLCYIRTMTGLPCPGCGLTTAAEALLIGDWKGSLTAHAGIFLMPLILLFWLFGKRFGSRQEIGWLILLALFLAYFIIRLILFFPNGPYPMIYRKENIIRKIIPNSLLNAPAKTGKSNRVSSRAEFPRRQGSQPEKASSKLRMHKQ